MYKDPGGSTSCFERFLPLVERSAHCEIVICPSFLVGGECRHPDPRRYRPWFMDAAGI